MAQSYAILDIGSSKVICLICGFDGHDSPVVHGAGICNYKGYRNGIIEDETSLTDALADAISTAENEAKRRVRYVSVGIPAPFIKLIHKNGELDFSDRPRKLNQRNADELINDSLDFEVPEDYELISSTPVEYIADGAVSYGLPIGEQVGKISADVSHIYADSKFKQTVSNALLRIGVDADMFIAEPLAEGLFVIPAAVRAEGALLIDTGAAHTDVCLMRNGALIDMRTVDIGGNHFTSDIMYGLNVDEATAENVKRKYIFSRDYQDRIDTIRRPGGEILKVEHEAIRFIVESRADELSDMIKAAIDDMAGAPEIKNIYLTGGGITLMRGSCEFLEKKLGLPIQVRMPWMPRLSSPNYSSAFSVMDFAMHASDDGAERLEGKSVKRNPFRKLIEFFK